MSNMIVRAKSFERWLLANFDKEQLEDIATHGANCGWPGLSYSADLRKLFDKFDEEIWELCDEEARDCGETIFDVAKGFEKRNSDLTTASSFKEFMVWWAAEIIARRNSPDW